MEDSRKRARVHTPASSSSNNSSSERKVRRVKHPDDESANGVFVDQKLGMWQQHIEQLNLDLKTQMAAMDATKPGAFEASQLLVAEYLRVRKSVKDLYHRPVGQVVAMGSDDTNQLGVASSADEDKKVEYPPTLVSRSEEDVIQVAAGGLHSVSLTQDGRVFTWGVNDENAIGRDVPDGEIHAIAEVQEIPAADYRRMVSVQAGDSHTLFLSIAGRVYMCGMYKDMDSGMFCNLGPGETLSSKHTSQRVPILIPFPRPVIKIASRSSWNAAILTDGSLYTWGMGHAGELARSESMGAKLVKDESGIFNYDVGKLFIGEEFMDQDVDEKTGKVSQYQSYRYHFDLIAERFLKPAPVEWAEPGKYKVQDVSCGDTHLLVLARKDNEDGLSVYSSGHNQYGQLGHGDTLQRHKLTRIKFFDNLAIAQLACGDKHSLARATLGNIIYSWGRSDYGQLGLNNTVAGPGDFEMTPEKVPFPESKGDIRFADVAAGPTTSMVILDNADVYTWGFNTSGATGHRCLEDKTNGSEDILRPKKLDIMRWYKKNLQGTGTQASVLNASSGGQHSLMVINRFI